MNIIYTPALTPYRYMWDLQKLQAEQLRQGNGKETIFITEHTPVFTLGFHGNEHNMLVNETFLTSKGVELIRIERGGDITFHGPGQIVVYPIIDLKCRCYGVKGYVERLEQAVINTCARCGLQTYRVDGATGVWCGDFIVRQKICAIGVKISHGITYHGLAFNVSTDLSWFDMINPCGFTHNNATSLQRQLAALGRPCPDISEIKEILASELVALLTESSHNNNPSCKIQEPD